ncbi:uncharacterized protein [Porites lutea]|uniref:uncharacterized protein n=1 Tax=Porites lutea TaxID=51062 RepID=UPI003CC560C0
MANTGKKGYIFEVDLEYPPDLWDLHNGYPLAPELMKVNGVEKLICHFKPRKNYVIHYRALRQCLELENIRKRQNIVLVDDRKKALKLSSRPNFDRCIIFDRNLIAIHMKRTEVYFNKPVYVGQSILDLSKTLMYDFHYEYIKSKYGKKAELLFTDTDSLMYQIKTKDFYEDICYDIKNKFDTSDYPSNHPSGITTGVNKKVIGMFKDEASGKQITHFVGLRPKLYSYKVEDELELKKCKGIKKNVVKKTLIFDDYVRCLFSGEKEMRKMKIIRSENHDLYSKEVNKVALSNQDDKRHVLNDHIHTLAIR